MSGYVTVLDMDEEAREEERQKRAGEIALVTEIVSAVKEGRPGFYILALANQLLSVLGGDKIDDIPRVQQPVDTNGAAAVKTSDGQHDEVPPEAAQRGPRD